MYLGILYMELNLNEYIYFNNLLYIHDNHIYNTHHGLYSMNTRPIVLIYVYCNDTGIL